MSTRAPQHRSSPTVLTPLDRTRLLIGVVMIPLAASMVFAAGSYSQVNLRDARTGEQRPIVEVRAVYADRERREEAAAFWLADADGNDADSGTRLHSPPAALDVEAHKRGEARRPDPLPASPFLQVFIQPSTPTPIQWRGPPHANKN